MAPAGSALRPIVVGFIVGDFGIRYVFAAFAEVAVVGGLVTLLFAIETKGRVLEELSPLTRAAACPPAEQHLSSEIRRAQQEIRG